MSDVVTDAERIWLWRRREGLALAPAAKQLGLGRTKLSHMEHGHRPVALPATRGSLAASALVPTQAELLRLARRRAKVGGRAAAAALGVSHVTYLAMEAAAHPRVYRLWGLPVPEERGFTTVRA